MVDNKKGYIKAAINSKKNEKPMKLKLALRKTLEDGKL